MFILVLLIYKRQFIDTILVPKNSIFEILKRLPKWKIKENLQLGIS
jgi:hypothetical protein